MGRYVGKGKNRRYQVFRSPKGGGKKRWMYAKMPGKSKSTKKRARTKARTTTTRRRRYVPRKKKQSRARKMTLPLGLLVPGLLGTYDFIQDVRAADSANRGSVAIERVSGWHPKNGTWDASEATFTIGWGAGAVIHRGVGGYLGVNRMLAANRVPFIRV